MIRSINIIMTIRNIKIIDRSIIKNVNGDILKYANKNEKFFKGFGEIYFSEIKRNKIKGWNYHKKNYCLFSVPFGKVIFNFRKGEKTKKVIISKKNYRLILLPPRIWFSFTSLVKLSVVANIIKIPHDDKETLKRPIR